MSGLRTSLYLGGLAAAGGVLGGFLGAMVGFVAPGYYLAMFRDGVGADFNPVQIGIGLGAGQGAGAGFVLGLCLAAVSVWRTAKPAVESEDQQGNPAGVSSWGGLRAVKVIGFGAVLVLVSCVSFLAGGIVGQSDLYTHRAEHETQLVKDRLSNVSRAQEFSRVEYARTSNGYVLLSGSVQTKADFDRLYRELQDLFGTERANDLSARVAVSLPVERDEYRERSFSDDSQK